MEAHVFQNFFLRRDLTFPVKRSIKLPTSARHWHVLAARLKKKKKKNRYKYIIPREARRGAPSREVYNNAAREARVYHTSIARPAWFPLGYKSIKFGWCPPWRHPVSDVRAHYGFPGNRLPSTTKLWVLFMKTVFFHLWIITMFTLGKSPNMSGKTKENSKLNNGGFNKWLEILAGKDFNTNKTPQERGRRL